MKTFNKILALILAMAMCMVGVPVFAGSGLPGISEEVKPWDGFTIYMQLAPAKTATFILAEKEEKKENEDDKTYVKDCTDPNDGTERGMIVVTTGDAPTEEIDSEGAKNVSNPRIENLKEVSFKVTNTGDGDANYEIVAAEGYKLSQDEDTYTITADSPVDEKDYREGIVIGYLDYKGGYGTGEIKANNIKIQTTSGSLNAKYIWNFKYNVIDPHLQMSEVEIAAPDAANGTTESAVATWAPVEHAGAYEVVLSKNGATISTTTIYKDDVVGDTVEFDFLDQVKATDNYKVSVKAIGESEKWITSEPADDEKLIKVAPVISPEEKNYIKGGNGFEVVITPNGNTLVAIRFGDDELVEDEDYSVDGNVVKFNDCAFKPTPGLDEGDFEDPFAFSARAGIQARGTLSRSLSFEFRHGITVELPVVVKTVATKAVFILAEKEETSYTEDNAKPNDGSYDGAIVVAAAQDQGDPLTNFTAVSFEITNTADDGYTAIEYEIVPADGYALLYHEDTKTYEINVKPENGAENPAVSEENPHDGIVIGYIKYPGGYGKGTISASNVKMTTKISDNLYNVFDECKIWDFTYEVNEPTQNLTVTVDFNLPTVTANAAAYEQMKLNVYSARLGDIVVALGNDVTPLTDEEIAAGEIGIKTLTVDTNKYTVVITNLPAYEPYTVSVKGDGYRTAKISLNLNEDKTVQFWNNAKDNDAVYVKTADGVTEKMIDKNFLAGDIIMDGKIDLYDLSAVSSYFGKGTGTAVEGSTENGLMTLDVEANADYIQYDLNRDGKVDILDITMVIDGWAK